MAQSGPSNRSRVCPLLDADGSQFYECARLNQPIHSLTTHGEPIVLTPADFRD